jgi:hypothetical protein
MAATPKLAIDPKEMQASGCVDAQERKAESSGEGVKDSQPSGAGQ